MSGFSLDSPQPDIRRPTEDVSFGGGDSDDTDIEDSAVDLYNKNSRDRVSLYTSYGVYRRFSCRFVQQELKG